jgi:hypothetical protein
MTTAQGRKFDADQEARRQAARADWAAEAAERLRTSLEAKGFRHFGDSATPLGACPWRSALVAMIAIGTSGAVTFANKVHEKRGLLLMDDHTILVAWPGNWSQDVFRLTPEDKAALLAGELAA